jgi:hypothetical protein
MRVVLEVVVILANERCGILRLRLDVPREKNMNERSATRHWRYTALIGLGAGCIVGTVSSLDQWLSNHRFVHLEFCLGFFVAGCIILYFSPERILVVAGSFGLVALLGLVNAVASQNFVAAPLVILSVIVFLLALWWHGSRTGEG